MALEIIPAIDLRGGKAVRIQQGQSGAEARVAEDPVKVARQFAADGATRLHVVDLDGVRVGTPQNVPAIRDILRKVDIPVQVGGGFKTLELAERVLNLGAARILIGTTAASRDDALIVEILHKHGNRVIIGADMKDGFVATEAWTTRAHESMEMFGKRMVQAGAKRFLFTDVSREGTPHGVNVEATVAFARLVGVPVLASGGVAGKEDIEKLAAVSQPGGVEGVIIGKALYSGALNVADALTIAAAAGGGTNSPA